MKKEYSFFKVVSTIVIIITILIPALYLVGINQCMVALLLISVAMWVALHFWSKGIKWTELRYYDDGMGCVGIEPHIIKEKYSFSAAVDTALLIIAIAIPVVYLICDGQYVLASLPIIAIMIVAISCHRKGMEYIGIER